MFGVVVLFGGFFVTAAGFVRGVPLVGPVLGKGLAWIGSRGGGGGSGGGGWGVGGGGGGGRMVGEV